LARRSRAAAVLLALLAAVSPARATLRYLNTMSAPSPEDQALDWFQARAASSWTVVETRPEGVEAGLDAGGIIGFERTRHDFVPHTTHDRALRLLAREADLMVTRPGDEDFWGDALLTVYEARQRMPPPADRPLGRVVSDGPLVFRFGVPRRRAVHAPVDLRAARLAASERPESLEALRDGATTTAWSSAGPARGGEWLRVELPAPVTVGRVEWLLGGALRDHAPEVLLRVSADGRTFEDVAFVAARPPLADQWLARRLGDARPPGEALVFEPRPVQVVELRQGGLRDQPWSVAELRVFEFRGERDQRPSW
jgi:hypothetical protein